MNYNESRLLNYTVFKIKLNKSSKRKEKFFFNECTSFTFFPPEKHPRIVSETKIKIPILNISVFGIKK